MNNRKEEKDAPNALQHFSDVIDYDYGLGHSTVLPIETKTQIQHTVVRHGPDKGGYTFYATDGKRDTQGNPTDAGAGTLAQVFFRPLAEMDDSAELFIYEEQIFEVLRDRISAYPDGPERGACLQMLHNAKLFFLSMHAKKTTL